MNPGDVLAGVETEGLWHFVCHASECLDGDGPHEALTESRAFAYLCLYEHEHRGHDAEVLRVA